MKRPDTDELIFRLIVGGMAAAFLATVGVVVVERFHGAAAVASESVEW